MIPLPPPKTWQYLRIHRDCNGKETGREVIEQREPTYAEMADLGSLMTKLGIPFRLTTDAYVLGHLTLGEDSV